MAFLKAHGVVYSEHVHEYLERSILALPKICINGGRRGYLVGIAPEVCVRLLDAQPVDCALDI